MGMLFLLREDRLNTVGDSSSFRDDNSDKDKFWDNAYRSFGAGRGRGKSYSALKNWNIS